MDFTSLPEKFKVGSDASPSHSELSFPSSPPSRVWGGPQGEAGPSRTVSPSLQQAKGTPRGWLRGVPHPSARPAAETRCLTPGRAPSTRGREAEGPSESQSANTSGAPPVSAGWTLGTLKGGGQHGLTHGAWGSAWGPPRHLAAALGAALPVPGRPGLDACRGPGPAAMDPTCSGAQGPRGHCRPRGKCRPGGPRADPESRRGGRGPAHGRGPALPGVPSWPPRPRFTAGHRSSVNGLSSC